MKVARTMALLLLFVVAARADYLIVQVNNVGIKEQPDSQSDSVVAVQRGTILPLASPQQTNGYYEVELPNRSGTGGYTGP